MFTASLKKDALLFTKILHGQMSDLYHRANEALKTRGHSAQLRREFETEMHNILFQYRDVRDEDLVKCVNRFTT